MSELSKETLAEGRRLLEELQKAQMEMTEAETCGCPSGNCPTCNETYWREKGADRALTAWLRGEPSLLLDAAERTQAAEARCAELEVKATLYLKNGSDAVHLFEEAAGEASDLRKAARALLDQLHMHRVVTGATFADKNRKALEELL